MKMSKSDAGSAVFVHDAPEVIERKIMRAFCPPDEAELNPVIDWASQLVIGAAQRTLRVKTATGQLDLRSGAELRERYLDGTIHPMDLKEAVARSLIDILEPARRRFAEPALAAALSDLEALLEGGRTPARTR